MVTTTKTVQAPRNAVANTGSNSGIPQELIEKMDVDAGKGVSTAAEDNIVPLIYILQKGSPQVDKRATDKYIENAEMSDIWLRNSQTPIVEGTTGIVFQPCWFYKEWVEWAPRDSGRGIQGRYKNIPQDAVEKVLDPQKPNKRAMVRANGNIMIETRYHAGFVYLPDGTVLPYVIPFKSTGHTQSKEWMFLQGQKLLPNKKIAPSFAALYRLKTVGKKNNEGEWFAFDIKDAGDLVEGSYQTKWVDAEQYARGLALHDAFATGAKVAEEDAEEQPQQGGAAPSNDDSM